MVIYVTISKLHCHGKKGHRDQGEERDGNLYEDESYWDKGKGYSTHKRTCIGKKGADGEAIYNTYYRNREKMHQLAAEVKKPNEVSNTTFVGETMILDKVTRDTAISRALAGSFGENDARKIIALSYYRICRGKALSNAEDSADLVPGLQVHHPGVVQCCVEKENDRGTS